MKRLVIAGLPCPPEAWRDFLSEDSTSHTRIISMGEVLSHTEGHDPRDLATYVHNEIGSFRPDSIVCHGIGVPLALLGIWRLRRQEGNAYNPRITIFNGGFRKVSLLKARQPLWIQLLPARQLARHAVLAGGKVDSELVSQMKKIRAMYRAVILHRATEKISALLGFDHMGRIPRGDRFRLQAQIIASANDPFLPLESMRELASDLGAKLLIKEYGHFPYSAPRDTILPSLLAFEKGSVN